MKTSPQVIPQEWFSRDAVTIAQELLGKIIEYKNCSGMIVETEAYMGDPASHAYKITPRSEIMLNTYGHIYVYFSYESHFCMNITTNKGEKGAVLIRALEPLKGILKMQKRRHTAEVRNLMSGPGKLCQALGIDKSLNGTKINTTLQVFDYRSFSPEEIGYSQRIGITKATDLEWRFFVKESAFVSKRSARGPADAGCRHTL